MNTSVEYEAARQTLMFAAFLTAKDPDTHLPALRQAVDDMIAAWEAHKAAHPSPEVQPS